LVLAAVYFNTVDRTFSDLVVREFKAAHARDKMKAKTFHEPQSKVINISDNIAELIPMGTPKDKVLNLLKDEFSFIDVSNSYKPEHMRAKYREIYCADTRGPHFFIGPLGDEYTICFFFNDKTLGSLHAEWVSNF
jgi:hypothetical protein